jgi:hypothetical protein
MLARPLHLLEEIFPSDGPTISEEQWNSNRALFCNELSRVVRELSGIAKLSIPRRVFVECKEEMVVTKSSGISVCEFRIRPPTSYYNRTGQPVPSPENPNGSHGAGLKLAFSLYRGFVTRKDVHPACLSVEFEVWQILSSTPHVYSTTSSATKATAHFSAWNCIFRMRLTTKTCSALRRHSVLSHQPQN